MILLLAGYLIPASGAEGWKQLAQGMDYLIITAKDKAVSGESRISVVRIDPDYWELVFSGISQPGERFGKTACEWCKSRDLTAAINAGMFATDGQTHVGYLRFRDHVNSRHINNYQSVMAFDPKEGKELPLFSIFDLDAGVNITTILKDYNSAIQNLRLIKKPGINVWRQQDRKWSEAAIGEDKEGRILFIFSRSPITMYDLNNELLGSGIGIVAAQHLEGGPEAQLYINTGGVKIEMFGSYETGFNENNSNPEPWPVPNVIGVRPRKQVFNGHSK